MRKIGGNRAGEVAAHRLSDSDGVSPPDLLAKARERTVQAVIGLRIIAIQDTTEINFSGRDTKRRGLRLRETAGRRVFLLMRGLSSTLTAMRCSAVCGLPVIALMWPTTMPSPLFRRRSGGNTHTQRQ